ncbi:hypothetical protein LCGC14_1320800 [marine sediment metagenome]|uniref:Uncharacterized protein n=1 Tax=marine sediment metagenome TaxID=412755 RepID=A0A0F9N0E2_9ZZZZ
MANRTGPFGLEPVFNQDGSPWNAALIECFISSSYAVALFVGDPVTISPTLAERDTSGKRPTVNTHAGTSGLLVFGVIRAFKPDPTNLELKHNPASNERICWVARAADDLVFRIRDNADGTPTKVFPGQNAEMVAGAGGSTVTGKSSFALDASTPTTTQAFPLHILGLADIENNELADSAIWDVVLNTNQNATGRILGITAA